GVCSSDLSSAARIAIAPSSVAGTDARPPPTLPKGVRTADTITARAIVPQPSHRVQPSLVNPLATVARTACQGLGGRNLMIKLALAGAVAALSLCAVGAASST